MSELAVEAPEREAISAASAPTADETSAQATESTEQAESALALVKGERIVELPKDLYIPPEALEVFLDAFEGPLDLLLYLIKRQNLDILDIPVATITEQYMDYINLMQGLRFELAAEYLVMAAMLAEIKSRMLLPRSNEIEEDEVDPRAELVRRLQEYERFKQAAEDLDTLNRIGRDIFPVSVEPPEMNVTKPLPDVALKELLMAFKDVMARSAHTAHHHVNKEPLSIRERMTTILTKLQEHSFCDFTQLFTVKEGKMGVVVSFIAILELLKQSMIEIVQAEPFSPIHIKAVNS